MGETVNRFRKKEGFGRRAVTLVLYPRAAQDNTAGYTILRCPAVYRRNVCLANKMFFM